VRRSVRGAVTSLIAATLVAVPSPALAHGIGGRADLPVPLGYFLVGAGVVLIVSFIALAVLWKTPRLQDGPRSEVMPLQVDGLPATVLSVAGVFFLFLVIGAGLFGVQNGTRNVAPATVWVVFWLVVPFLGALVGNIYTPLNPWRTLSGWLLPDSEDRQGSLERWGVYPAAVAIFGFTWLELVWPDSGQPRTLAAAALLYTFYVLLLAGWGGRDAGLQSGELFTTYNRLISSVSPFGRDRDGRLVRRGWLRALPVLPAWPGLTFFVVLMIGTVSYDGLSGTSWWRGLLGSVAGEIWAETLGMMTLVAVIGGAYAAASWGAVALTGGGGRSIGEIAASFAHTLVPIALAYAFAHYFTLVLFEGQLFISTLSDPFGWGWNLFGTADREVRYFLAPEVIWYVQVATILLGHVAGVVLAHDRALAVFPEKTAVRSQYAMLVLMVLLTSLGLTILASG
jgi:hypothetical protein